MTKEAKIIAAAFLAAASIAPQGAGAQMYVRLETGYSATLNAHARDRTSADPGICVDPACVREKEVNNAGHSAILGGGVGWKIAPEFRVDVTWLNRSGYKLTDSAVWNGPFDAKLKSNALMANGYWDIPVAGWHARPYLGAGVGVARNTLGQSHWGVPGTDTITSGASTTRGAFSVAAGAGIPMANGYVLDVGYRFADMGKFGSGTVQTFPGFPGSVFYTGFAGKLRSNEITVGVRF